MEPITIRMAGYGPPDTGFSRALKRIGERLQQRFGDRIDALALAALVDGVDDQGRSADSL